MKSLEAFSALSVTSPAVARTGLAEFRCLRDRNTVPTRFGSGLQGGRRGRETPSGISGSLGRCHPAPPGATSAWRPRGTASTMSERWRFIPSVFARSRTWPADNPLFRTGRAGQVAVSVTVVPCRPDSPPGDRSGSSASGGRAPVPSQRDSSRPGPPTPPAASGPNPACATMVAPEVIRPDGHSLTGRCPILSDSKGMGGTRPDAVL